MTRYLLPVVGPQVGWSTVAAGEDLVPVSPGQTVVPHLTSLTAGHLLAQAQVGLRHSDVLDGRHHVMSFSGQNNVI